MWESFALTPQTRVKILYLLICIVFCSRVKQHLNRVWYYHSPAGGKYFRRYRQHYQKYLTPTCSTEDPTSSSYLPDTYGQNVARRFNYTIIIYLSVSLKTGCPGKQVSIQTVSRTKLYLYHFLYNIQLVGTICSMSGLSKQKVPLDSSCQNTLQSHTPSRNLLVFIGNTSAHNPTKSSKHIRWFNSTVQSSDNF